MIDSPSALITLRHPLVIFGPAPPALLDDLRTVSSTTRRTGEQSLANDEFDDRASRAVWQIEEAAKSKTLWTYETENVVNGSSADIVMCGDPAGDRVERVGELVLPGRDRALVKSWLWHLGSNAERDQLAIVVHTAFGGHRKNALAFAAKVEKRDDKMVIAYLARLFIYPSEAVQWRVPGAEATLFREP